jgi:hypothetical protein
VTPRQSDKLVYNRDDLAGDGAQPSQAGRQKVANVMLEYSRMIRWQKHGSKGKRITLSFPNLG